MNTNRISYTQNEEGFSILVIILGFGLFFILSIITILFRIFSWFDLWNTNSEWYQLFEITEICLLTLPYLFAIMFYFLRFGENIGVIIQSRSLNLSYHHYPPFFGSKWFRRIMWIFFALYFYLMISTSDNEIAIDHYSLISRGNALLFCMILILISRLIERDNNSDKGDIPEDTKLSE